MAVMLIVNGSSFSFPSPNDNFWGQSVTDWATAITNGTLQRSGGSFNLLADVDFGFGYGLKTFFYQTKSSNVSTTGQFRLARPDSISWRNTLNDSDISLSVNEDNRLTFNSHPISPGLLNISSDRSLTISDSSKVILVNTTSAVNLSLPSPSSLPGIRFTIKDTQGLAGTNSISLLSNASELIEGGASPFLLQVNRGSWTIVSDGQDWHLI